jgi:hypothetical protein
MLKRRRERAAHVAKVAERVRMLATLTPLAHADAVSVETRILHLIYGHRKHD